MQINHLNSLLPIRKRGNDLVTETSFYFAFFCFFLLITLFLYFCKWLKNSKTTH